MNRFRRIFLNIVAGTSVLLMVLTVAEWVRTDRDEGWIYHGTPSAYWEVTSSNGHLCFARATGFNYSRGWQFHLWSRDSTQPRFAHQPPSTMHGALGFRVASGGFSIGRFSAVRYSILDIAYWGLLLIFSLVPATLYITTVLRLRRLTRRQSHMQCAVCGYDLRATHGRCPECGTVPNHSLKTSV